MGEVKVRDRRRSLSARRTILPLLLAVGSLAWFFTTFFDADAFREIPITLSMAGWLVLALCMVGMRAGGYMARLRILSGGQLSWKQSFQLIFLWEYASAVTPSTVGGSAVAIYLIAREKISAGFSTAIVLVATFLDEIYFILLAPVFLLTLGPARVFGWNDACPGIDGQVLIGSMRDLSFAFYIGYGLLFAITLFITVGMFARPGVFRSLLLGVTSVPGLKRFRNRAGRTADEMRAASEHFRKRPARFWAAAMGCTALSWTARYLVLNWIFVAFTGFGDFLEIFSRQFVMWIIMLIPATPGSSLIAETVFTTQMCPYVSVTVLPVVLVIWRLMTYLPYLVVGPLVLPYWMRKTGT